jgi:hypothetical protein
MANAAISFQLRMMVGILIDEEQMMRLKKD